MTKEQMCIMFISTEPNRFSISRTPWGTAILIDKCWEYYDTPPKE